MGQETPVRLGVIGTGSMGGSHARVAAGLAECTLVGLFDTDASSAAQVGRRHDVPAFASLAALCAEVEAVVIATPAVTHPEVAAACLDAGCHVLLEKPMAATPADAERLLARTRESDRIFMVGHVERYNPAFVALQRLVDPSALFALDFRRMSTAPGRDSSVNVIFDLMIHDIDLALALLDREPVRVEAVGHAVRDTALDHVTALVRFAGGASATITASTVSHERYRVAQCYTRDAQYTADFANREVWVRRFGGAALPAQDGGTLNGHRLEQVALPFQEPLAAELTHFCQAVRAGTPPRTGAAGSLRAVALAHAVAHAVTTQREVALDL
jgi:predicted dehydrogenase